jgi:2-iminobutanoate/2-iminopropanoate deaminase
MKSRIVAWLATMLVAIALFAAEKEPNRRSINLPGRNPQLAFSDGILVGNTLYLSGRLGLDPKTGQAPPELDQEIRLLLDGVKSVLAQAGMAMDDLVSVQVFCPDLALYDKFNAVYKTYFAGELPARAFVGSGPLLRGAHFEVLGTAVKRMTR